MTEVSWDRRRIMTVPIGSVCIQFHATYGIKLGHFGDEVLPQLDKFDEEEQIEFDAIRAVEASRLGIDPRELAHAVEIGASTGHLRIPKGRFQLVSIDQLIGQLNEHGFFLTNAHWREFKDKGQKVYMTFGTTGNPWPNDGLEVFTSDSVWNDVTFFCNPELLGNDQIGRKDCIVIAGRKPTDQVEWIIGLNDQQLDYDLTQAS